MSQLTPCTGCPPLNSPTNGYVEVSPASTASAALRDTSESYAINRQSPSVSCFHFIVGRRGIFSVVRKPMTDKNALAPAPIYLNWFTRFFIVSSISPHKLDVALHKSESRMISLEMAGESMLVRARTSQGTAAVGEEVLLRSSTPSRLPGEGCNHIMDECSVTGHFWFPVSGTRARRDTRLIPLIPCSPVASSVIGKAVLPSADVSTWHFNARNGLCVAQNNGTKRHARAHQYISFAVVRCGFPGHLANGYVIGQSYLYGDIVHYSCHQGHRLVGPKSRRCSQNGAWTGSRPVCRGCFYLTQANATTKIA